MNTLLSSRPSKHSDLVAAGAVVLVVAMMIIPLPPFLLDLCITLNISAALVIVVATLYVPRALDFSSFPTLLLLTTLFRLAINVSVTRLILLHGDAGHVVEAFGNFVVGGNVVVGLVIFLILDRHPVRGRSRTAPGAWPRSARASPSTPCPASRWRSTPTSTPARSPTRRRAAGARRSPARPTSTARWTAPRSSSRATPWPRVLITAINLSAASSIGVVQQGMPALGGRPPLLAADRRRRPRPRRSRRC